jgi:hypothetical protein
VWLMDRGVPTEADLARMRSDGVGYLVGTPSITPLTRIGARPVAWTRKAPLAQRAPAGPTQEQALE